MLYKNLHFQKVMGYYFRIPYLYLVNRDWLDGVSDKNCFGQDPCALFINKETAEHAICDLNHGEKNHRLFFSGNA